MVNTIHDTVRLNNGLSLPVLGLGVYRAARGTETEQAVSHALKTGYRLIDTAAYYGNEADVGKAVRQSGIERSEIFITTKLANDDQGYTETFEAFERSLGLLNTGYIDLYLIHYPVPGKRLDSWKALEEIYRNRKEECRSIGVSNFTIGHLTELMEKTSIIPAVNQVEFSPFLYQRELLEFCRTHRVLLEAYSPLTKGRRFDDPRLVALCRKYGKTPAQMLIRWCLQHKVVVIPKSVHPQRIEENAGVFDFEITEEDMEEMNGWNENYRTSWDPTGEP